MAHNTDDSNLYTIIKVVRNEDLYQQIGRDVYFDLVDHDKVCSIRILRYMLFHQFKEVVAKKFGVSVQLQRFWLWTERENKTYRPHRLLTHEEETQYVYQLKKVKTEAGKYESIFFLEVLEIVRDLHTLHPPPKTGEDILLFFKLYEPEKQEIRYVGKLLVNCSVFPRDILKKLNDMVNFAADEEIELYEEIRFLPRLMCELVNKEHTFLDNQLVNGDIICFQKAHPVQMNCRYPDIPSFLGYILRLQGLQEAKSKVVEIKSELMEAEADVAALEAMLNPWSL